MNNIWASLAKPLRDRPGDPHPAVEPAERKRMGRPRGSCKLAATAHQVREARRGPKEQNPWGLTARRVLILDMLVLGMGRAQIATTLSLCYPTIANNVTIILKQMGVQNVPQAILAWHRHFRVVLPDLDETASAKAFAARLGEATTELRALRKESA